MFLYVYHHGIGDHFLIPDRALQWYPCNGCVNVEISYQSTHPILGGPEDSLYLGRKPCHMLTGTDDGARTGAKVGRKDKVP